MTRHATLVGLHRSVLEDERSHGVGVTLDADSKLTCGGPHLVSSLRAVRIMAVAALHESRIDAVAERPRELSLLRGMASEAQVGLLLHQHEIHVVGFVRAVT